MTLAPGFVTPTRQARSGTAAPAAPLASETTAVIAAERLSS
jgi:hypothetical protein